MGSPWAKRWGAALLVYTGVLIYLTHMPTDDLAPPPIMFFDKLVHFGLYGLWGGMAGLMLRGRFARGWLLAGLCLGAADEITQPYFQRTADWADWVADGVGVVAGLLTAAAVCRLFGWSASEEV